MLNRSARITAFAGSLLASTSLASPVGAQTNPTPPPVFQSVDENGVDLASGRLVFRFFGIEIGPGGPGSLGFNWSTNDQDQRPEIRGYINTSFFSGNKTSVVLGGSTRTFSFSGSQSSPTFTSDQADGSSLTYDPGSDQFTYTMRDGAKATFHATSSGYNYSISSLIYPAGQVLRYYYTKYAMQDQTGASYQSEYLTAITSSLGYQLRLEWTHYPTFNGLSKTVVFNMANENCDPSAPTCTLSSAWPTVTRDMNTYVMSDNLGRKANFAVDANGVLVINLPSGRKLTYNVTQDQDYRGVGILSYPSYIVSSFSDGKGVWQYNRIGKQSQGVMQRYNPGSQSPELFNIAPNGQIISHQKTSTNPLSESMQYDSNGRMTLKSVSDGNNYSLTTFGYDGRGNLVEQRQRSITSGTPADIVTSSSFPASCENKATCNQPTYTVDARGNRTDYTYTAFGAIQTITRPAGANGVRPMTTMSYVQAAASFGGKQGDSIWLLGGSSECQTQASCAGSADEVKTTISYDATSALLPTTVSRTSGDNSVSSVVNSTFYATGDVKTVDGPLPGNADSVRYYYDSMRRETGIVGPDPDGGGPLRYRAIRTTYAPDGQVAAVDQGTTSGQADGDMGGFSPLQSVSTTFDSQGRPAATRRSANGATFGLTEFSYTTTGQPLCTAVRMNPDGFGGATDACTSTTQGSAGPDRITRIAYDSLDRPISVTSGLGSGNPIVESKTYDSLGRLGSITDSNNNLTSYAYDGMNRLQTTTYPDKSFEQLGYDPSGNIVSRRLRDGQILTHTYDALNQRVQDHNPNTNVAEVSVDYTYDNMGRLLRASDGNGWYNAFSYNALGRATTQASNVSSTSLLYDASGALIRQTWADGFFVTYEHDTAGQLSTVRENGNFVLASMSYDDLGRRIVLSRGNGVSTSYSYNANGLLGTLSFTGAAPNTYTFSYNAAGQITGRSSNNDAFVWTSGTSADRTYATNALNQYTSAGGINFNYDTRGNLTQSGGNSYQYNTRNQLFMNGSGQLIYRGPMGYLGQTPGINYDWVNGQLAQESSDHILRRYVYGSGPDELLVWYEGSGTTDRRWPLADERGSIVAVTNGSGGATINSYDEYGIPAPNNQGRLGYTGQIWLPELGMWDYKARMYSPSLGRFMQTDPIGYGDGLNWYAYAQGDPINNVDPTGLTTLRYSFCPAPVPSGRSDTATNGDIVVTGVRCHDVTYDIPDDPLQLSIPYGSTQFNLPAGTYQRTPTVQPSTFGCIGRALWTKEGVALGLDALGIGVGLFAPEAYLAQLALSGTSLIASGITTNRKDMWGSIRSLSISTFGFLQAGGSAQAKLSEARSLVARNWGKIGLAGALVGTYYDYQSVKSNYDNCIKK
ncbi:RHS repeat-associated core domain-containing protein [Sphingomonas sp. Leaf21]|uniref:RHS repeat-associated core domain-containing protein n=1 Tax=Sphingomonas sp. Leaf21 TaxID=2876550 RepID=UPI001E638082|nr:RHS repeat-associated core domain-containing protein [Sphingomonas sp. Leaf21]